jgi:signal transduction histidine kinase
MIRTLYVRLVLAFISIVLISLFVSFFISTNRYRDQTMDQIDRYIIRQAKQIITLYQSGREEEIQTYLKTLPLQYYVWIYDKNGEIHSITPKSKKVKRPFGQRAIDRVLKGGVYRGRPKNDPPFFRVVGLPFQMRGEQYALFIQLRAMETQIEMHNFLLSVLYTVFIIGSIQILIVARYLVKPIKALTSATKKLSQGNFDVRVDVKRKDEIGTLANSFNQMAAELGSLEQMRKDFISNVSHEIQSPLTSLRGYSEMLKEESLSAEERKRYLDIIQEEIQRLSRLSENLLNLASLESDHPPFHPEQYSLDEQLRRVVVAMEPQWSAKSLELDLSLEKVEVVADPDQLKQVWINLLSNSVKFTPEGGTIGIRMKDGDSFVKVEIADTGVGIPAEDLAYIFERFYTGDRARSRRKSGNGLGLSIAKKIIELHQGEIYAESEVGKGTTFTVVLPKVRQFGVGK